MDLVYLAAAFAVVDLLAVARLVQMLGWPLAEATIRGIPGDPLFVHTGQAIPIGFTTKDGKAIETSLRRWEKSAGPGAGAAVAIRYNPADPAQVEQAGAAAVLALVVLVLTAGFAFMTVKAIQSTLAD